MADANTPPVGEQRRPGMDHQHHAYRTLTEAPRFVWPDDARIAFTVTLVLDYWEVNPPEDASPRSAHRVAVGQIFSRLAHLEPTRIRRARRHLPRAGRAGPVRHDTQRGARRGGGEALSGAGRRTGPAQRLLHGARHLCDAAHQQPHERSRGTRASSPKAATRCALRRERRRSAWCGQDFNESDRTPALLAEAGFTYTTDWASDDRPFLLERGLVALPPQPEWNDLECMWLRRVPPPVWADNIAEAFAYLHDEGGASFNLTLHPWIAGQAHRIRYLRDALSRVLGRQGIWRTTTDEVARRIAYRSSYRGRRPCCNSAPTANTATRTCHRMRPTPASAVTSARSAPHCVETVLFNVCPNCGGGFVPRPIRPATERRPGVAVDQAPASDTARPPEMGPRRNCRRSFARCATSQPEQR